MISTLVTILIAVLILVCIFYVVDMLGVPHPINMVIKVILALVLLLWALRSFGLLSM